MKAPCKRFNQTRLVTLRVYLNSKEFKEVHEWDEELWVCRPEEWYALMSDSLKYKRVRVITDEDWQKGTPC